VAVPEKQAAGRGGMIWAKLRRPVRGGLALTQFRRWLPTESRPRRLGRPLIRHAICFGRNREVTAGARLLRPAHQRHVRTPSSDDGRP
jgi:hypothetical protein